MWYWLLIKANWIVFLMYWYFFRVCEYWFCFFIIPCIYLLLKYWFNEFLISLLLLNYSKVYLWRQSASRRSTSINQELQGMSSKFQLDKPFLFLNVSVVFRSDSEKLVHFFRLPSCKCDICCLEKGDLEVTESLKYQNKNPCRIREIWAKWFGRMFSLSSAFMSFRKKYQPLGQITYFSQIAKIWSSLLVILCEMFSLVLFKLHRTLLIIEVNYRILERTEFFLANSWHLDNGSQYLRAQVNGDHLRSVEGVLVSVHWKRLQWSGDCCAWGSVCRVAIFCSLMEMDNSWLQMLWKQLVMQNYLAIVPVELDGVLSTACANMWARLLPWKAD